MSTLETALEYAARGFHVFPLREGAKKPATRHGCKDATTNAATIRQWWENRPQANIGIACGPSGLLVVDTDVKNGAPGLDNWYEMVGDFDVDSVPTVTTPSGGKHFYFSVGGESYQNTAGALAEGIDTRANGGYVVAPPSATPDGPYTWNRDGSPPPVPPWLAERLATRKPPQRTAAREATETTLYGKAALHGECSAVAGTPEGKRNARLNTAAFRIGQLVAGGEIREAEAREELANAGLEAGLEESETFRTIESGLEAGKAEPRSAEDDPPAEDEEKDVLKLTGGLGEDGRAAVAILDANNTPPELFTRKRRVARVFVGKDGQATLQIVGPDEMAARLGDVAKVVRGKKRVYPPVALVRRILATRGLPFPEIEGVTECPFLRADGSICTSPGYDPATKLWYEHAPGLRVPRIPDRPTEADAFDALATLWDVFSDFPFVGGHGGPHAANMLAFVLTPLIRPALGDESTPMALLDAPTAGTGKSLLAEVVSILATGRRAGMLTAATSEEEWEKRITSILLAGSPMVIIDNIEGRFRSAALAKALTAGTHEGRLLGASELVTVPQRATWAATGNNIQLGGDLFRRCYWIRLDPESEKPWQRQDFTHPRLKQFVQHHRGELLAAGLTLARHWFVAGCPEPPESVPALGGGYDDWRHMVGGMLSLVGVNELLGNADELYENADVDAGEWETFLELAARAMGDQPFTARDVLACAELMPVMPADCHDRAGTPTPMAVGHAFRARKDKRYGSPPRWLAAAKRKTRGAQWVIRGGM